MTPRLELAGMEKVPTAPCLSSSWEHFWNRQPWRFASMAPDPETQGVWIAPLCADLVLHLRQWISHN